MFVRSLVWYLVCAMLLIAVVPRTEAGISPSHVIACPSSQRLNDIAEIQAILERRVVERRLEDLGFSAAEISNRLDELADGQLHAIATSLESLKVGQGGEGLIIGILIIVLIIGVILPLFGIKVWR